MSVRKDKTGEVIFLIFSILCALVFVVAIAKADCGEERWAIKTLADAQASKVKMHVEGVDVDTLRAFKPHARKELLHATDVRFPEELKTYQVHALLIGFKVEADEDFHLVIADASNAKHTMIAEIPSGHCLSAKAQLMQGLRERVEAIAGHKASAKYFKLPKPVRVTLIGVGFFDFAHGQTGLAPSGFELHPVLAIEATP